MTMKKRKAKRRLPVSDSVEPENDNTLRSLLTI